MNPLSPHDIITTLGVIGVLAALFIETGLLIGLVLPGDSLLFVAGIAASGTAAEVIGVQLSFTQLLVFAPLAAIAGTQTGYYLGRRYGKPFFERPDSPFFNQGRVTQTERWLGKYGLGKALVLARFVPIVRTLINPLCGIVGVSARKFFFWNFIGGVFWTVGVISGGYLLGEKLKGSVDKYLLPIVGVIILISLVPVGIEVIKELNTKKNLS